MIGWTGAGESRVLGVLERRVAEFDDAAESGALSPLSVFVRVMEAYTDTAMDEWAGPGAAIDPATADAVVARSSLIRKLAADEPPLVTGPVSRDHQLWTETGAFGMSGPRSPATPTSAAFVPLSGLVHPRSVKPGIGGFHTSTATTAGPSMWEVYLEPYAGSNLYPLPWYTWELELTDAASSAREIGSAVDWVRFVEDHGQVTNGCLVPDWAMAGRRYSGVHYTLPAIAAAQGFHFATARGMIPPAFWDVECTYWLRWPVSDARLVRRRN